MNDRDKIKLLKAIGWMQLDHAPGRWFNDDRPQEECRATEHLPDQLTNANGDYAVHWSDFKDALFAQDGTGQIWNYEIGDYAHAALDVISDKDEPND